MIGLLNDDPWYSSFSGPPRIEVLGAREENGKLRVHFIADERVYCPGSRSE